MPISSREGLWMRLVPDGPRLPICPSPPPSPRKRGEGARRARGEAVVPLALGRFAVGSSVTAPRAIAAGPHQHVVALVDRSEDVVDRALDALGRDAVLGVVGLLLLAPAGGLR